MIIFVISSAIFIGLVEGIYLFKKGMFKELIVVSCMLFIAISIQIVSNFKIFNILDLIHGLIEPIGKAIFKEF